MRKILSALLLTIMLFSLCACDLPSLPAPSATPIPAGEALSDSNMSVTFIDVGQGDCTFIELANGRTILIDAGESDNSSKIIKYIKNRGHTKIDFVIATHPHSDHIGAMAKIIKAFDIGKVYMPKASNNTKTYENLLETISDKGLKISSAKNGVEMIADENIFAKFVAPVKDFYEDLNNYSAVLMLTYGDVSFLFTGDIETEAEKQIKDNIDADILKVAHHGSSTSSSSSFIKKVLPDLAIISCGEDNDYGHPHKEIIKRFEKNNIECLRTDISGNIEIITDGSTYTVHTQK